jgi:hypothetical protein
MRVSSAYPIITTIVVAVTSAACARTPQIFSEPNARAHIARLAETIGSRPVGTTANGAARTYIIDQLRQSGFHVRVQETDARSRDLGLTARVANIIAVLPGQRTEAIGLLSHVDSVAEGPGAADNALGVSIALETARIVAARPTRSWSFFVLVTDAEENGLMGAAALIGDREVTDRLRAYLNIEAIGSSGVPVLFETGPGNGWLTEVWARSAPHPRGGSYAIEIYKRLPNDTDFSIVKTRHIPGLNFAAIGDSYAYHTPRDTAARLSAHTVRTMGENAVAIVDALQTTDIAQRSPADHTFFDVAGRVAFSYGPTESTALAVAALLLGVIAWARIMRTVLGTGGVWRWLLLAIWTAGAAAAVCATLVGVVWLLRASREVYHPWYAHPGRLVGLLLATGTTVAWALARAGRLLPARAHGARHPALAWSLTLPIWIALAAAALWSAPSASYLWSVPLFVAGLLLLLVPAARDGAVRAVSVAVFAVSGPLWVRDSLELVWFMVAVMGRFPFITPVYLYPTLLSLSAVMVAPPLIAAIAPVRPLRRPSILTTVLLFAVSITAALAYTAPAYTQERPLRRHVRALQEPDGIRAVWEVGSVEPGLDLTEEAPVGFAPPGVDPAAASIPWGRLTFPFVFRATTPPLGPPPATVTSYTTSDLEQGAEVSVTVVPQVPGVTIAFVLPEDVTPARSNLPGVLRAGRWTATFVAPPPEGVSWRSSFSRVPREALSGIRVVARLPWGIRTPVSSTPAHWSGLPSWLPQERSVWTGSASWVLNLPPPLAPPGPLR